MENYTSDSFYNGEYHKLPQDNRIRDPVTQKEVEKKFSDLLYVIITDNRFTDFKVNIRNYSIPENPGVRFSWCLNISYHFDNKSFLSKDVIINVNNSVLNRMNLTNRDINYIKNNNFIDWYMGPCISCWILYECSIYFCCYTGFILKKLEKYKKDTSISIFNKLNLGDFNIPQVIVNKIAGYY